MPKEQEFRRPKGHNVSEKVYDNKIRLRNIYQKNSLASKANEINSLETVGETSNSEKRIHEVNIVTSENGSRADGKKLDIETVYYQNEIDESGELDNLEALQTEESTHETHVVEGRRIVELAELGKKLWCGTCREALSLSNVEKECRRGFGSLLLVRCHKCLIINEITTGKMHALTTDARALRFDINTDLALGKFYSIILIFGIQFLGIF